MGISSTKHREAILTHSGRHSGDSAAHRSLLVRFAIQGRDCRLSRSRCSVMPPPGNQLPTLPCPSPQTQAARIRPAARHPLLMVNAAQHGRHPEEDKPPSHHSDGQSCGTDGTPWNPSTGKSNLTRYRHIYIFITYILLYILYAIACIYTSRRVQVAFLWLPGLLVTRLYRQQFQAET